jgi:hypothetical protein
LPVGSFRICQQESAHHLSLDRVAGPFSAAFIVPASNFGSAGLLPVGKASMSPWGNYDMAGNGKEWIWNQAGLGKRYLLAGAWDEADYLFTGPDPPTSFVRAANIGFAARNISVCKDCLELPSIRFRHREALELRRTEAVCAEEKPIGTHG